MGAVQSQATYRLPAVAKDEFVQLDLRVSGSTVEMLVDGTPNPDQSKLFLDITKHFAQTPGIGNVDKFVITVPLLGTDASARWIAFLLANEFKTQIKPDAMYVDGGFRLVDLEKTISM